MKRIECEVCEVDITTVEQFEVDGAIVCLDCFVDCEQGSGELQ